jgi:hydroxymethylglutaryl-CoA reductase (NADPH)
MSRAPALKTPSIHHSIKLIEWIKSNFNEIKKVAESTTSHGKLIRIDPFIIGKIVYLRFTYQTGDAMGMNMVTKATHEAIKYIKEKNNFIKAISLSGNVCTDKKNSSINWILGRGKTVVAEATILREIVEKTLKTTPEEMVEVNYVKNYLGSARAGTIGGHNAHVANVIAGIFIATGQDPAQIIESAAALTSLEIDENGNLYASLFMPSLEVGTIGGGTRLPTQRECLRIMDCEGEGRNPGENAKKFAEIIASAALAGEISLIAALASDDLVKAHEKFGRNKIY